MKRILSVWSLSMRGRVPSAVALALVLVMWGSLARAETSPRAAVGAIVDMQDMHVSDLEAVFGSLHRNRQLESRSLSRIQPAVGTQGKGVQARSRQISAAFEVDVYHSDPTGDPDPRVRDLTCTFPSGATETARFLQSRFGAPTRLTQNNKPIDKYGNYYFQAGADGSFAFSWYLHEPAFAFPTLTAEAAERRYEFLASLSGQLRTLTTDGLPKWHDRALHTEGVQATSLASDDHLEMTFKPALDARQVARAFGIRNGYLVSSDVHQISFEIHVGCKSAADANATRVATQLPRRGRWVVTTRGERPPGKLPGLSSGASPAYSLDQYNSSVDLIEVALGDPQQGSCD